jgi:hypothetical protein
MLLPVSDYKSLILPIYDARAICFFIVIQISVAAAIVVSDNLLY